MSEEFARILAFAVGGVFFVAMLVSVPWIMRGRDSPPPTVPWWVLLPTLALVLLINWLAG